MVKVWTKWAELNEKVTELKRKLIEEKDDKSSFSVKKLKELTTRILKVLT